MQNVFLKSYQLSNYKYSVYSQLRLHLIILVTFGHNYDGVAEKYCLLDYSWDSHEVLKTQAKWAMPMFFVISGYPFLQICRNSIRNVPPLSALSASENSDFCSNLLPIQEEHSL